MALFLRYTLKYLGLKCHDAFNLISSESAKYSCFIHTHVWSEREREREGKNGKILKTDDYVNFTTEIYNIYLRGLF